MLMSSAVYVFTGIDLLSRSRYNAARLLLFLENTSIIPGLPVTVPVSMARPGPRRSIG